MTASARPFPAARRAPARRNGAPLTRPHGAPGVAPTEESPT
ncbi:hypothetical protein ABZV60_26615 [Streptomyces sp. NPDC004787]